MSLAAQPLLAETRIAAAERRKGRILFGAAAVAALLVLVDLGTGPGDIALRDVLRALANPSEVDIRLGVIVWDIRLPVALQASLLGAMLGLAGAQMQTILDNPLADPFTLGVSSAAGVGASIAIVTGLSLIPGTGPFLVSANAFVFAFGAALLVFFFSVARGATSEIGDDRAASLGADPRRLRLETLLLVAVLSATSVSYAGVIGFIGLVGPHIARLAVGEDQRWFAPLSAVCGAALLSAASIAAKSITPGVIYPIGIVTALVGVPVFLSIIGSRRSAGR